MRHNFTKFYLIGWLIAMSCAHGTSAVAPANTDPAGSDGESKALGPLITPPGLQKLGQLQVPISLFCKTTCREEITDENKPDPKIVWFPCAEKFGGDIETFFLSEEKFDRKKHPCEIKYTVRCTATDDEGKKICQENCPQSEEYPDTDKCVWITNQVKQDPLETNG